MSKFLSRQGLAEAMVLSYFAFEGISRIAKNQRDIEVWVLTHKVHQLEVFFVNNGLMPFFEFSWVAKLFSPMLVIFGLVELATIVLLWLSNSSRDRPKYIMILAVMLMFDALVTYIPFSELDRNYGKAISQFTFDFIILGGLYQMAQSSDQERRRRKRE